MSEADRARFQAIGGYRQFEKNKAKKSGDVTSYDGQLEIFHDEGVVVFSGPGMVIRITHLKTPVPRGAAIDITAIEQVTSFIPIVAQDPGETQCQGH